MSLSPCACTFTRIWSRSAQTFKIITLLTYMYVCARCLCHHLDYSLPGFSFHGIFRARIVEWIAMPRSRGSSQSRNPTHVSCLSCIAGGFFIHWATQTSPTHTTHTLKSAYHPPSPSLRSGSRTAELEYHWCEKDKREDKKA